jgi:hypothetical protein
MPHLISPNRSHRPYKSYSIPPPTSLEVKLPEENPTIGLLLCKSAKKTVVELTLLKDANTTSRNRSAAEIDCRRQPEGRAQRVNISSTCPLRNC